MNSRTHWRQDQKSKFITRTRASSNRRSWSKWSLSRKNSSYSMLQLEGKFFKACSVSRWHRWNRNLLSQLQKSCRLSICAKPPLVHGLNIKSRKVALSLFIVHARCCSCSLCTDWFPVSNCAIAAHWNCVLPIVGVLIMVKKQDSDSVEVKRVSA
jgi:hypothetical protein